MNSKGSNHLGVSVLIRVRNEAKALRHLLDRLKNQRVSKPFEVVVLDNESEDDSATAAVCLGARVFTLPRSMFGYGRAINVGVKLCRADLVVLLSAHSWPESDNWLQQMIDSLNDSTLVATYCRQVPAGNVTRQAQVRFDLFPVSDYRLDKHTLFERCMAGEDVYEVCAFSNAACIIRREIALRIRFRDLPYAEDRAFVLDCTMAGHSIMYLSSLSVVYDRPVTLKTLYHAARSGQISKQLIRELGTNMIGGDLSRPELGERLVRLIIKPVAIVVRVAEAWIWNRIQLRRAAHYAVISVGVTWGFLVGELVWRKNRANVYCDTSSLRTAEENTRSYGLSGDPSVRGS